MNRRAIVPQFIGLVMVLLVAFFFRFYQLDRIPPGLNPDEATHALDALEILDGQLTLYSPDEGSTGSLWRYLLALDFAVFGSSISSLRVFASSVGVLSVGMAYLLIRELALSPAGRPANQPLFFWWPEIIALAAGLLLAVSYWHVDLSRIAFSAVLMLLIQDAAFFCMWRAVASGRRRWFVLFGLGVGLLAYNYLPGKLVPLMLLLFFLLNWLIAQQQALAIKYWRSLLAAAVVALILALPLMLFALFNYQMLLARAAVPAGGVVVPFSPLTGLVANLSVFGLWPNLWLSGRWEAFFLGPVLTACFMVGVGVSLSRIKQPVYLFLLVWWLVMLLPGALAPEGAIPHTRRAISIATATYALASLGLATLIVGLVWLFQQNPLFKGDGLSLRHRNEDENIILSDAQAKNLQGRWSRRLFGLRPQSGMTNSTFKGDDIRRKAPDISLIMVAAVSLLLVGWTGVNTFRRYFVTWGPSDEAKLAFHVYDLELADLMARDSGPETVYLLPLDSAAGIVNPLLDTITFVYQGQAAYDFLPDDEDTLLARLSELTTGKRMVRLLRWNVTKHTGADPKKVAHYYLEKWGEQVGTESHPYFEIDSFELNEGLDLLASPETTSPQVDFEGQMRLTEVAFGAEYLPAEDMTEITQTDAPVVPAGNLIWVESTWQKIGDMPADYQIGLWLEDEAGHVVGRIDGPLLSNRWHQGASRWDIGQAERSYFLLPVDPTAPPGVYRLKTVLYTVDDPATGTVGRRLAPALPDIGADLAVTLGRVAVTPSLAPPDPETLPIPQRLELGLGEGLSLLGFDPGFAGSLRPGDRATVSVWWQASQPLSRNLAVAVGLGNDEQTWPLSEPRPVGGAAYPTRFWEQGTVLRSFIDIRLPAGVESGLYNLGLRLLDAESGESLADWLLGPVEVQARARTFAAPALTHQVAANFGDQITFLGYDLDLSGAESAGIVKLELYWQAQREMETPYKLFVHFLDESGQIVAQVDREPLAGVAPTTGWLAGEIITDLVELPADENLARVVQIAVGWYDPASGERLPLVDATGQVEETQAIIELE